MNRKPKPTAKPDPRSQAEKFRDLAVELECDDDEEAFKNRVRQMATAPKAPEAKSPKES